MRKPNVQKLEMKVVSVMRDITERVFIDGVLQHPVKTYQSYNAQVVFKPVEKSRLRATTTARQGRKK